MKKSFLKKILIALTAFTGIFVMASCQTTDHNAIVPSDKCLVDVYEKDGQKTAVVQIAVSNPTIYNTSELQFTYEALDANDVVLGSEIVTLPIGIRHGAAGVFAYSYTAKPGEADNVKKVRITNSSVTAYQSLWQTYMPAFIVAICLASLSVLFFGIEMFRRGITKEMAKEMFAEHIASELTILGLVLIICLIPLIFSSWVTTVILLGGFGAAILLTGLLTLLRIRFAK